MEVLGGLLICGVALVPLAALVLLLNVWQRVQRLEETVRAMKGAKPAPAATTGRTAPPTPAVVSPPPATPEVAKAPDVALTTPVIPVAPPAPAIPVAPPAPAITASAAADIAPIEKPFVKVAVSSARAEAPPLDSVVGEVGPPASRGGGFERTVGTRLMLWVGAILVALAGVFFFKWAIDNGWFGEIPRVITGIAFGLGALGAAERLRARSRSVAGGTAAAGIAVLYTTFLVATNIYELLPLPVGGLCMAATTAAAVMLSLRYGPVIVLVGMVGGFLTPALLRTPNPSVVQLFGYLALLQLGVLAVARRRDWDWAGLVVLGGGGMWLLLWVFGANHRPGDGAVLGLFALFGAAALIVAAGPLGRTDEWNRARETLSIAAGWVGTVYAAILLSIVLNAGGFRLPDWLFIAVLGIGTLALGRLRADWDRVPWLAAAVTAGLLVTGGASASTIGTPPPHVGGWLVLAFGLLYSLGGYGIGWRAADRDRWAMLASGVAVTYFLVARDVLWPGAVRLPNGDPVRWGVIAALLAGALALAAAPIVRRRAELGATPKSGASPAGGRDATALGAVETLATVEARAMLSRALAALGIGAVTLLAIGAAIDLEHWWLAPAWAVLAAGACWTALRLQLPELAYTAWPLAALTTVRLLAIPELTGFPISRRPLLNAALLGYGVPIVALIAAAHWAAFTRGGRAAPTTAGGDSALHPAFAPRGEAALSEALRWMSLFLTLLSVHLLIGHGFHGRVGIWDPGAGKGAIVEWALHMMAPLGLALALGYAAERWRWRAVAGGRWLLAWGGFGVTLFAAFAAVNPLFRALAVGPWPVLNWLLLFYGGPAALCLLIARQGSGEGSPPSVDQAAAIWQQPFAHRAETRQAEALRWLTLGLAVMLAHGLIGHGFHRVFELRDPGTGRWAIVEWTLHMLVPLGLALLLRPLARRWPWRAVVAGGWLAAWWGLVLTALIGLVFANPWAQGLPVGRWPVFNALLLVYGAPAVLSLWIARTLLPDEAPWLQRAAAAMTGILGFTLISFEVRHAFHGTLLAGGEVTARERYSYSLAWTLYGLSLLAIGINRKLPAARYASLAVMIVTVCKVFLVDTSGLTGLYRVASLLGLGISLLGLAFVYQRFVFNTPPDEAA